MDREGGGGDHHQHVRPDQLLRSLLAGITSVAIIATKSRSCGTTDTAML